MAQTYVDYGIASQFYIVYVTLLICSVFWAFTQCNHACSINSHLCANMALAETRGQSLHLHTLYKYPPHVFAFEKPVVTSTRNIVYIYILCIYNIMYI